MHCFGDVFPGMRRTLEGARPGVGVSRTQAFPKRSNDPLVLNVLALGFDAEQAMQWVAANDPDFEYRQMGMIKLGGGVAMHTGAMARPWAGHQTGADFAASATFCADPRSSTKWWPASCPIRAPTSQNVS